MKQHYTKLPIEQEPFTEARIRIAIALIKLDYRRDPTPYSYPPLAILDVAERLRRRAPWCNLFSELIYCAKAVEAGIKLDELPWLSRPAVWRALHKLKPRARAR